MGVEVKQDNSLICNILMEKNIVMFLVKLQTTCVCVLTHPPTHRERDLQTHSEREKGHSIHNTIFWIVNV